MQPKRIRGETVPWVGHRCPVCGAHHRWPAYVFAHYRDVIIHNCTTEGCKVRVRLYDGTVTRIT